MKNLIIEQDVISLFASGESVLDIPKESIDILRDKTYTISMNYGFHHIKPHANIHSDAFVSQYISEYIRSFGKQFKVISRTQAFRNKYKQFEHICDHYFESPLDLPNGIRQNYTICWTLGSLKEFFPDKTILIFGLDMGINKHVKFYDTYQDYDMKKRGPKFDLERKLNQCKKALNHIKSDKFINCNFDSKFEGYTKDAWTKFIH